MKRNQESSINSHGRNRLALEIFSNSAVAVFLFAVDDKETLYTHITAACFHCDYIFYWKIVRCTETHTFYICVIVYCVNNGNRKKKILTTTTKSLFIYEVPIAHCVCAPCCSRFNVRWFFFAFWLNGRFMFCFVFFFALLVLHSLIQTVFHLFMQCVQFDFTVSFEWFACCCDSSVSSSDSIRFYFWLHIFLLAVFFCCCRLFVSVAICWISAT